MPDLAAAIAYIDAHGSSEERSRLRRVLDGAPAPPGVVAVFLEGEQPGGGWAPFWAPGAAGVDATCFRLARAHALGLEASEPAVARALAFLAARQRPDGTWEEDPALADAAPPWVRPGDPAARLYLTANAGYWLALHNRGAAAARAAEFLTAQVERDGRLPSFLHTCWLTAGLLWKLARPAAAGRLMDCLSRQLDRLGGGGLAWLLTALLDAGVAPGHALVQGAAGRLSALQQPDGRWQSDDGPAFDPHATAESVRALRLAGRM